MYWIESDGMDGEIVGSLIKSLSKKVLAGLKKSIRGGKALPQVATVDSCYHT